MEYCDKSEAINREQYYLETVKPEYNILQKAGSPMGRRLSEETKAILRARALSLTTEQKVQKLEHLKVLNASEAAKDHLKKLHELARTSDQIARARERMKIVHESPKMINFLKTLNSSQAHKDHLNILSLNRRVKVEILDTVTSERKLYNSIREAAEGSGLKANTIGAACQKVKEKGVPSIIKKRYMVIPEGYKSNHSTDSCFIVEVFDSLTTQTIGYVSRKEAALAIGCDPATIGKALQNILPGEFSKLILKRYKVKLIVDNENKK